MFHELYLIPLFVLLNNTVNFEGYALGIFLSSNGKVGWGVSND
jgi:hypothetical protein